jgi:hypothetical protein
MEWISVEDRVPDNRRKVLAWGRTTPRFNERGQFLGATRFNPSRTGGRFDIEAGRTWITTRVTHWAEIQGPEE